MKYIYLYNTARNGDIILFDQSVIDVNQRQFNISFVELIKGKV